jgi:D-alanine-D-alanine ligase
VRVIYIEWAKNWRELWINHREAYMAKQSAESLGHIGVLMGGISSEKEISFKSGKAILKALVSQGCRVSAVEIDSSDETRIIGQIRRAEIDLAFIALHGEFGEDGQVQSILEKNQIAYTGSGVEASRVAINKIATQSLWRTHGITVPPFKVITTANLDGSLASVASELGGYPLVVKPSSQGSSIGISMAGDEDQLLRSLKAAAEFDPDIIVEKWIKGREMTAGILDNMALPFVEIKHSHSFFDYASKYQHGASEYLVPAQVDKAIALGIQEAALKAFALIGCRDFARLDFILDENNKAYFLEVNTIPGFTATSLLPMAAKEYGYSFEDLCLKIATLAAKRRKNSFREQPNNSVV